MFAYTALLLIYPSYIWFFQIENNMNCRLALLLSSLFLIFSYSNSQAQNPRKKAILENWHKVTRVNALSAAKQQLDSIQYFYNEDGSWLVDEVSKYSYNSMQQLESEVSYIEDSLKPVWVKSYKSDFIYDNDNRIYRILGAEWNEDLEEWKADDEELVMIYDNNGNLLEMTYGYFEGEKLVGDYKIEYQYRDTDEALELETASSYNSSSSSWEFDTKTEYKYNSQGNRERITEYTYDRDNEVWLITMKQELSHNSSGQIESALQYFWIAGSSSWQELGQRTYTYDAKNNPQSESYAYSKEDGKWANTIRFTFSYDLDVSLSETVGPPTYFFLPEHTEEIQNMYMGFLGESYNDGSWGDDSKAEFFYSDGTSTVSEPNPLKDQVLLYSDQNSINIKSMTTEKTLQYNVVMANGKLVQNGRLKPHTNLSIEARVPGLYLVQIQSADHSFTHKLMVR